MVQALKTGKVTVEQLPLDFVDFGSGKVILNTRTAVSLELAGIPRNMWVGVDRTGQAAFAA